MTEHPRSRPAAITRDPMRVVLAIVGLIGTIAVLAMNVSG